MATRGLQRRIVLIRARPRSRLVKRVIKYTTNANTKTTYNPHINVDGGDNAVTTANTKTKTTNKTTEKTNTKTMNSTGAKAKTKGNNNTQTNSKHTTNKHSVRNTSNKNETMTNTD